jgi:predicted DNA-binding transcriptional regulator AlpA
MEDHPTDQTPSNPATPEPAEPKQRKHRADHHAELLMGLANKESSGDDASEPAELELWDCETVLKYFGGIKPIHVSTLYRGINSGRYPRPMNVSDNVVRWIGHECREARQRMLSERAAPKTPPPARRGRPRGRKPAAKRGAASNTPAIETAT